MNDVIRTSNERVVPTFEGRLFTDSERHGLAGNWVRRAEVDVLLDEIERLRGDLFLSQNAVSALGRQRSDWKAAYEGAIQRNAHETSELLERENKAASDFIRGCIEALGMDEPPEGFRVNLDALLLQVIGEIESLKGEVLEHTQKANSCVCGEPNSPGTHRTDGPCLAPIGDHHP